MPNAEVSAVKTLSSWYLTGEAGQAKLIIKSALILNAFLISWLINLKLSDLRISIFSFLPEYKLSIHTTCALVFVNKYLQRLVPIKPL